jgi:hypothetical protein
MEGPGCTFYLVLPLEYLRGGDGGVFEPHSELRQELFTLCTIPCPSIDSLFTAKVESENGTTSDMMEAFVSLEVRIAPGILHYMHAFPKVIDNDN